MRTLLLVLLFTFPLLAQDRPAATLDTTRVEIVPGDGQASEELARIVRSDLRATGSVAFPVRSSVNFSVVIAASRLDDDVSCRGFVAATLVVDGHGKSKLWVDSAGELESLGKAISRSLLRKFKEKE